MRAIGGLLLLAAALKMYGLAVEPVGRAGIFSEPWLQTAVVEWEIILGLWLLWGRQRAAAWLAATVTFVSFAVVSGWQGWIGQASCGCFGAIRLNPWIAFAIDVGVLIMLACARRQVLMAQSTSELAPAARRFVIGAGGTALILGILAVAGTLTYGSPAAALAYLRGERISAYPGMVDFGQAEAGSERVATVELRNWTKHPIRLIGGTADCSCTVTEDLPVTVPAGEGRTITVKLRMPNAAGLFTRKAMLRTDDAKAPRVGFRLTGRILEPVQQQAQSTTNGS